MKEEIVLFVLTYIFVFLIYQFFIVRTAKKNRNDKSKNKPIEVRYIMKKYNLTMKDVNYNQMLQLVALISSFDIALVVSIMFLINNFILEILVGVVLIVVLVLVSYNIVGKFYRKKVDNNDKS